MPILWAEFSYVCVFHEDDELIVFVVYQSEQKNTTKGNESESTKRGENASRKTKTHRTAGL